MRAALFAGIALATLSPSLANAEPVLLISIDGLRPADVTQAEERGLKIPTLRRFLVEGAYASGVVGVLPTITYPSHTTLLTGASPAKHGVTGNTSFDPMQINHGGWFWYASDIKLPTLWEAASTAGMTTANVHWPVSVGAKGLSWNLPQIWRTGHDDDAKLIKALATAGLVDNLEKSLAERYAAGIDESVAADENRGRFAVRLIAEHKPDFTTVYLASLDHEQHGEGPDTPAAKAVLERIDAIVAKLIAAERAVHPDAVIAVVSDHGFEATHRETNFFRAFVDAGLIKLDAAGKVTSWQAMPWNSGGSVAIMLANPEDTALTATVRQMLDKLMVDRANGIAAIANRAEIAAMGGNPAASFYVNLMPDTISGSFKGPTAPLSGPCQTKGTHGYFPSAANLRSSFMIMGPGVPSGLKLGEIDMRAIAPTLGQFLKVQLPSAELPPVSLAAAKE